MTPSVYAANERHPDDWQAWTQDLEPLGFEFDNDADTMSLRIIPNGGGPHVVCRYKNNRRADDDGIVTGLSLYWSHWAAVPRVSMQYGIRDNPTVRQVKELVAALKGE